MLLLDVRAMILQDFGDENRPPYAIASHRWTSAEVTFKEFF